MAGDVGAIQKATEKKLMTIEIPADLQPFVREQLQLGCFPNEQQLVTEALQLLKAEREQSLEGLRQGLVDAAAGRVQPLGDVFADLRREFNLPDSA
jgi:Arc/MetJ-type ribon-helix-helix transcriptional regulator